MTRQVGDARYLCAGCGRDVTGRPPSTPCMCGETLRSRIDVAGDSYALPGRSSLRYNASKNWTVKYLQFTWNLKQLHSVYAPARTRPDELVRNIEMTFSSCWALTEWLVDGPEPSSVTQGNIARLADGEPLKVCRALATRGGTANARIITTHIEGPAHAWIEYTEPRSATVRFDALDLADRSLAAWNTFLRDHQVPLPQWN